MQATKIFFSLLLGILAFVMSSCSSTEYRPTDGDCKFVIKKVDGKRQWGMVVPGMNGNISLVNMTASFLSTMRRITLRICLWLLKMEKCMRGRIEVNRYLTERR